MRAERITVSGMRQAALAAGALAVLIGGGHVVAWVSGMMAVVPATTIIMKTNAGMALLMSGLALVLLALPGASGSRRRWAQACAGLVLLVGLATFGEHLAGWNLGIDQLLATEQPGAAATVSPNRMGPPASLSFILLGTALLLLARRRGPGRRRALHEPFALIVALLGLLSVLGHLYAGSALYAIPRVTGMAWPTALSFVVLAVGVLCAEPDHGLAARVTVDDPGGATVRALLGPMVLLPLVFGWAQLAGVRLGWFDAAIGTSLTMLVFIVASVSLLLFTARHVSASSAAVRASEERFRTVIENMRDGINMLDLKTGRYAFMSPAQVALTGFTAEEMNNLRVEEAFERVHPDDRHVSVEQQNRIAAGTDPGGTPVEYRWKVKSGEYRWFSDSRKVVRDAEGEPVALVGVSRDITEQKRVEEALRRSEQFLSFALTTARMGAWDLDLVDHTARRSPEHDKIFGYEELLPQWTYEMFLAHVIAEDRDAVDREFRAAMEGRHDWSFECRIARHDGEVRWIWAAGRHRVDENGQPRRMAGVVQDITDRKRAEEALKKSEQQFRALIENVNAGVALIDETGSFSLYNRQFLAMFGLSPDSDIRNVNDQDWSAWQVFDEHGALLHVDEHPVRQAARTGLAVRDKLVEVRVPGREQPTWMLVSAEPLLDRNGRAERIICTYNEITGRKQAELALREANERLQEADQRKDEFLAVLSHELRNPLAPVRAALYVLERAVPGGEQANRARIVIDRQVAQLTRLVDDLLDVTRITRGKIHLHRETLDLTGLVWRTAEDHRELFTAKGIDLEVVVPEEQLWVVGDAQRLSQAVGNLLHNAAKFTEAGGRTAIRVSKAAGAAAAIISVSDTGVGINPQALPHLFEPFMQVDKTLDRARGGLGLGLALVKSLVEMHAGAVSAMSRGLGQGAEFTIQLPIQAAPSLAGVAPSAGGHRRRRVLVIEDNVDAAESLCEALELAGHEVEVAYTGGEGLEKARRLAPEIVLCDIGLPGMNGYEVARALRQDETMPSAHLVALTGYALPDDVAKAHEAGFDLHVAKPPSPEKLQEMLTTLGVERKAGPSD